MTTPEERLTAIAIAKGDAMVWESSAREKNAAIVQAMAEQIEWLEGQVRKQDDDRREMLEREQSETARWRQAYHRLFDDVAAGVAREKLLEIPSTYAPAKPHEPTAPSSSERSTPEP